MKKAVNETLKTARKAETTVKDIAGKDVAGKDVAGKASKTEESKWVFGWVFVALAFALLLITAYLKLSTQEKLEIENIDGIAYITIGDNVCKLLDASGRQVVFNGTVKSEHDLSMQVVSVGGAETYIVYDNDTKMCYIGIKDTKNKELVDMLNVMYSRDNIIQEGASNEE